MLQRSPRSRVQGVMIAVHKGINGFNKEDIHEVLMVREPDRTRSNGFKLDTFGINREIGKNWLVTE